MSRNADSLRQVAEYVEEVERQNEALREERLKLRHALAVVGDYLKMDGRGEAMQRVIADALKGDE